MFNKNEKQKMDIIDDYHFWDVVLHYTSPLLLVDVVDFDLIISATSTIMEETMRESILESNSITIISFDFSDSFDCVELPHNVSYGGRCKFPCRICTKCESAYTNWFS